MIRFWKYGRWEIAERPSSYLEVCVEPGFDQRYAELETSSYMIVVVVIIIIIIFFVIILIFIADWRLQ